MEDLYTNLNPQQLEAVTHGEGPILILAGAGSGKTRVLTHRLAHLTQERGVSPRRILAVTFTNKAANEMKERVAHLVEGLPRDAWIGTFHASCVRILRRHGEAVGVASNFTVFDDGDQLIVIKQCLHELDLSEKYYPPRAILSAIGRAKDELVTPEQFSRAASSPYEQAAAGVYRLYQEKLGSNNALDFDDLILRAVDLLRASSEVRDHYTGLFQHILIDEYQDINTAQYTLVKLLCDSHRNLCAVGDDDQSIYGFRGANVGIILAFERDFPEARVVKLEQNYRSTKTILDAAWHVVSRNSARTDKRLWTARDEGEKLFLYEAQNEMDEAEFVVRCLEDARLMGRPLSDCAVLYRTNAQSRVLEEAMIRGHIPYKIVGGLRFYDRKEIKDLLSYLKLAENPSDAVSLRRVINTPARGIGPTSLDRLEAHASSRGTSLYQALLDAGSVAGISPKIRVSIGIFQGLVAELRREAKRQTASAMVKLALSRSGIQAELERLNNVESQSRIENLQELYNAARAFEEHGEDQSLAAFLEGVALTSDLDSGEEETETVMLMTLHAAKGLEFPVVFLVGLEEGRFPHSRSLDDEQQLQEERRLCYVGITRAKDRLFLSYATERSHSPWGERMRTSRSRFVDEIPEELFATPRLPRQRRGTGSADGLWDQASRPADGPASNGAPAYHSGQRVRHAKFGEGCVVSCNGSADVTVAFSDPGVGVKKLSLEYARLEEM